MQLLRNTPIQRHLEVDRSQWTRKRMNHRLLILTGLPTWMAAHNGSDPWSWSDQEGWTYTTNPVWEAAILENDRLTDLYERKVPLARWGIEVPNPHHPFWGPLGDPAERARRRRIVRRPIAWSPPAEDDSTPDAFSLSVGEVELEAWADFVREMREGQR